VILIAGAFNTRSTTAPLAEQLARRFTVLNADRRGRGDSGDSGPYAIEREIEDVAALIDAAGGSAGLFGYSSGATLCLRAAASLPVAGLALYEPPFVVDDAHPRPPADLVRRLTQLIEEGRRGDAVELYQRDAVGMPEELVVQLRQAPFRPGLEAIAHTLVYDATIIGDLALPTELLPAVSAPALVIAGGESWPFMRAAAAALADALPDGRSCTLEGETHQINPVATAAVLEPFFAGAAAFAG
jgi:pimeloyl-ACP methyl ester carboxylesterase